MIPSQSRIRLFACAQVQTCLDKDLDPNDRDDRPAFFGMAAVRMDDEAEALGAVRALCDADPVASLDDFDLCVEPIADTAHEFALRLRARHGPAISTATSAPDWIWRKNAMIHALILNGSTCAAVASRDEKDLVDVLSKAAENGLIEDPFTTSDGLRLLLDRSALTDDVVSALYRLSPNEVAAMIQRPDNEAMLASLCARGLHVLPTGPEGRLCTDEWTFLPDRPETA